MIIKRRMVEAKTSHIDCVELHQLGKVQVR